MKNLKIIGLLLIGFISVFGFLYWFLFTDSTEVLYRGKYNDKSIKVKQITHLGFSTNTYSYSIKYGNLDPIYIDAHSTDNRGVPYDNSVFGAVKPFYFDSSKTYNNEITYDELEEYSMLYISDKDFSKTAYLEYEVFFKNHWKKFQSELAAHNNGFSLKIIGIVYGDRTNFIKTFSGIYENKKFNLTITPDGQIELAEADKPLSLRNSGFENKVQMPGKILLKRKREIGYAPDYKNFTDQYGKHINDYFTVLTKEE